LFLSKSELISSVLDPVVRSSNGDPTSPGSNHSKIVLSRDSFLDESSSQLTNLSSEHRFRDLSSWGHLGSDNGNLLLVLSTSDLLSLELLSEDSSSSLVSDVYLSLKSVDSFAPSKS